MARSPSSLLSRLCCATAVGISLLSSPVFAQTDTRGAAQPDKNTAMSARELRAPKVIFFDVNETLLDLTAMRSSVGEALGGRDDLLPLWFSTMLHHSLVDSTTGRFHTFGEIGVASLLMVAEIEGIELTKAQAKTAIVTPLRSLPPHPDVRDGLQALKNKGYKLVSLTNSSNQGVYTQFKNADLLSYFDERLSVEDINLYKPDTRTYEWAIEKMGIAAEDAMLVAAHGWDIAGAKQAGWQAAFIARPGKVLYPLAIAPDTVVSGLDELVSQLPDAK
ncbi:haloacid dehalogenase type II [Alteromonas macleodii]|uniref:(S)-2-haloacid dehalogenase n=3 Tax=Alteromonas TaxID=226 RepID=A0A1E7DI02_ALTMA|nr:MULTISPECIES: haloacid dehalogenase type II [Alteromonas]MAL71813.1 haloacid dehalogenase type II [Alteromonas sp.]MEC7081279.1 haloacid dehalogenase type II [Pseudomonadota bacterium]AFT74281.1 haloacid dehalogenase-like hydrolase [Alteromonas macleodii str. 'English Channel 673']AUI82274.1 haloacid dehalogenase, type II [Alteromonas macleodii]KHT48455.1 HAD family hydrolase [Alteromonas macleodii]